MVLHLLLGGALLTAQPSVSASAQTAYPEPIPTEFGEDDEEELEEEVIVVTGGRPRGSVAGNISPEIQLNAGDVRALGVTSVAELLEALAPETASARGRGGQPALLVNGTRISGRSEIRGLPSEAIVRVDILPEEAGLRYGFGAGQRVVNIVLRRRFDAVTAEAEGGGATAGGRLTGEAEAGYFNIREGTRLTVDAAFEHVSALGESEREIVRDATAEPFDARFRTLLPSATTASLNAAWVKPLGDITTLTLNGRADRAAGDSQLGIERDAATTLQAIERDRDAVTIYAAALLARQNRAWPWTLTGRYERTDEEVRTAERAVASGVASARAARETVDTAQQEAFLEGVITGVPFHLPAGDAALTVTGTARSTTFDSRTDGADTARESASRRSGGLAGSLELPIAGAREAFLGKLGQLSLNLNAGYNTLSDFGGVTSLGGGLDWSPADAVEFAASVSREDGPPTVRQLGLTRTETPEARYFDFVRGESVLVTLVDGGNPDLNADRRRVIKLGATLRPIDATRLSLTVNYLNERTRRPIGTLPAATAAIEAAFPDRFARDAAGVLVFVDTTPVNFASAASEQIRTGISWSETLERRRRPGEPALDERRGRREAQRAGAGPGERFGGRGGRGGRGGFGGGRVQVSLFHTWRLADRVRLADGLPALDLLGGETIDVRGRPAHEIEGRVSGFWRGFGARLEGRWQSATRVDSGAGRLRFGDLATVDVDLFANLDAQRSLVQQHRWLHGVRIGLEVENLFDSRQQVRDSSGVTPLRYQPALLDPLGRTLKLSLRKRF